MRVLLIALQIAAVHAQPDSARLLAAVDSSVRAFQMEWRSAWEDTQAEHGWKESVDDFRDADDLMASAHCHFDAVSMRLRRRMIRGFVRSHAVCPTWYSPDDKAVEDERHGIDLGLSEPQRGPIRSLRRQLRVVLDSAASRLPGDVHIAGQRVRFALDDGDVAGAMEAADACAGHHVPCGLLRALVLYRLGRVAASDSAFGAAERLMSDSARCAWDDTGMLLEPEARRRYEAMTCGERAAVNRNLWWLADPLWIEPGNERRVEHYARRELVAVIASLRDDGRQQFTPRKGGEAVIESLVRYGWPSQMYWAGWMVDRDHGEWLLMHGADTAAPYVVREYTRGRIHAVPTWQALQNPLDATPDAWQLEAPRGDRDWWPAEHYARDVGGIAQLPEGQGVMLRRRDSTRFVLATDVDDSIARPCVADASCRATLFESRAPDEVRAVAAFDVRPGRPIVVDAPLSAGKALVGIELPGAPGRAAARTRHGIRVAEPLSTLEGAALSEPLLFAPAGDASTLSDADAAIARMYGTTTLQRRRLGVYWESYGLRAGDTLDVEVRITNEDRPSLVERVAHVFGVGSAKGGGVSIRWRDLPGASRAIYRMEGRVPLQMRSVVLDLSRLARGHYRLRLSMARAGGAPVTSERTLELR